MRNSYITAGLSSIALTVAMSLNANAQNSTTTPQNEPPAAAPSQSTSPQSTAPQDAPSQSVPAQAAPQAEPSQAAPAEAPSQGTTGQAGSAAGHVQAHANAEGDNPLNLTDEQKTKLRPIIMEETQQLNAVRDDNSMTHEQKAAKASQIRETASPKIKAILTPEQLQKLAQMQQKAVQQQNQSAPAGGAPPQK